MNHNICFFYRPPFTELDATHAFVEPHKVRLSEVRILFRLFLSILFLVSLFEIMYRILVGC